MAGFNCNTLIEPICSSIGHFGTNVFYVGVWICRSNTQMPTHTISGALFHPSALHESQMDFDSTKISHCFVEWEFKNEVVIILFALRGFVRSTDACCEVICSVYKGPANVYINIPLAFKSLRRTYIMGICNLNWCPLNVLALISAFWASKVLHKPWQDISVDGWHWKSPGGEW